MAKITILYDGWTLCRSPLSSPALHLLDILANLPDGIDAHVAVPEAAPAWLPAGVQVNRIDAGGSERDRLRWEQRTLPALAGRLAAAIHLMTPTAPLVRSGRVFVSPAGTVDERRGLWSRLRGALGRGGAARARLLWPADLPPPLEAADPVRLPISFDPRYRPHNYFLPPQIDGAPEIPATFYLVHIRPDRETIRRALEAWTWASGPIGEVYPLVFLGLPESLQDFTRSLARRHHLGDTFRFFPAISPADLHLLYQSASAVFLPEPAAPWHSPLHLGLVCGVPVVGLETAVSSAVAGPAAYLVPGDDPRSLGSALIATIIKDELRKQLKDAALKRVAPWSLERFRERLGDIYTKM